MARSKIGFHTGPGGMKQGLGAWELKLNKAGQAFGLKAADEYGPVDEALRFGRENGVENWLGFRFTKASGRVSREVPDYNADPKIDAPELCQEVIDKLPPEFDKAVWLEVINEPRAQNKGNDTMFKKMNACDYLGEWCLAAAKFLNKKGYKFMGPSFNSGEPGFEDFPIEDAVVQYSQPGMLKFLRYCAEHPDKAALSVHEYSWSNWQDGQTAADWYPSLWGRFEAAIAAADLNGIPRTFPIFVTEFGFAHREAPSGKSARPYLDDRNRMTARWPQLKYDASWSLQEGWEPIDRYVNSWLKYNASKEFDEGQQPAATHASFGGTLPGAGTRQPLIPEESEDGESEDKEQAETKPPAARGEVSSQSIILSPKAGVRAIRLVLHRREGDQWRPQLNFTHDLDGESRIDIVYLGDPSAQPPDDSTLPGKGEEIVPLVLPADRVLGMDISYAQDRNIDFKKAAEAGVKFVFIRAGSGQMEKDPNFEHNFKEAGRAGMLRGIYYYQYPENEAEVGEAEDRSPEGQARRFASMLKENAELGAVLDVEEGGLTADEVKRFVDEFQKHDPYGRPIAIYTRASFWNHALGASAGELAWAAEHPLWVAHHTSSSKPIMPGEDFQVAIPKPWQDYPFYQWTSVGGSLVGQKKEGLDLNYFMGSAADLKAWARDVPTEPVEQIEIIGVKIVTSAAGLYLREGPSKKSAKIKLMDQGTEVGVIEEGEWDHLKVGDDIGYAYSGFLKPQGETETPIAVESYSYQGPPVKFYTGLHGPADDGAWNRAGFKDKIRALNLPLVFMSNGINPDFADLGDPARNVVRLYWNPEKVSAGKAYEYIRDDQLKRWWDKGYKRFIFFNEPQLTREHGQSEEGMKIAWNSAEEFAKFLHTCLRRAKEEFDGIYLYTTPVTSNDAFDPWGWREAIWKHNHKLVDGWCMHAYSGNNSDARAAVEEILNQVKKLQRKFRLQIPIIVSEASVNRGQDAEQKARVALLLAREAAKIRGLESVFWYAADWHPDFDVHHESWFRKGIADAYLRLRKS